MKVLQVINSLATGGAEKLLLESVPKYNSKGIVMDILVLNGTEYPFFNDFQKQHPSQLFSLGKGNPYNPFLIFKLIPYLKKYDCIHVHLFPALYWVAIAKWISFSRTKIVFTEHSTSNRRMGNWLLQKMDAFLYTKYNAVICITKEVETGLKQHLSLPNNRFVVIENGIDLTQIATAQPYGAEELGLPENASVLVQVASFQFPKDQATVIRSLKYLPENVHLLLVGQGPQLEEAKRLAWETNEKNRVHFLGVRMDVPNLLKTADIVILSSQYEGLSLSCLEGMASGKPFIASDVPGLKEMVGDAGILFPLGDEKELAERIGTLLDDKEKYTIVAKRCREKAQQFDNGRMIESHIKLYQSLQ